ncbi:flagellar protein FlaG [Photobacterium angustum]|uniref:flagellar protein FlaG n=1 Tax=Photobacterium angustum TaxID=661 RepID=UPI0005DCB1ED|nr:flagellar protein FlaG [Photobacterium angustum]KJG03737.1 flagellar protein FlaG [Photobacterium angustum]KJG18571.1 flagellar protein FlaG [Photobacterium angustum]KJG25868.1 flagellar protein FlaG [Photobacterium angustum]KJG34052.1 flagellar protein FlaG [Photobacterium angustum]PSV69119.1 flagellar biosynthesis protein FlaG [Photobacterium angustum]
MAINPTSIPHNIHSHSLVKENSVKSTTQATPSNAASESQTSLGNDLPPAEHVNAVNRTDVDDPLNSSLQDSRSDQERIKQIEMVLQQFNRSLRFYQDEETGEQIATIVDKASGEIIRQVPAQELLELNKNLAKHALSSLSKIV